MAAGRDRLAAMRAQREQGPGNFQGQQQQNYEMNNVRQSAGAPMSMPMANINRGGGGGGDFAQDVDDVQALLRDFESSIQKISQLHAQGLNIMEPDAAQRHQVMLDEQVGATRQISNELKNRITALKSQAAQSRGAEARIHKNQADLVSKQFVEKLQDYQNVERDYRAKYRTRVERQFKLVKPDATEQEVQAVLNDTNGAGGQIFAQALTTSTRYNESRMAYREAQERHQEILKIEQNIAELAQLMNDMSVLVQQADEQIAAIEQNATGVEHDMEQGNTQVDKAIKSARNARRMRWVCFWITLVVVIIIAAVLAWFFTVGPGSKKN